MQCEFIKKDNAQCQALAVNNSEYCYFHNKNSKQALKESSSKGGKTPKKVFKPLPAMNISDSKSVVELLTTTINEVRKGDLDVRIANCLGFLSSHLLRAIEQSDVIVRIEKLENAIREKPTKTY